MPVPDYGNEVADNRLDLFKVEVSFPAFKRATALLRGMDRHVQCYPGWLKVWTSDNKLLLDLSIEPADVFAWKMNLVETAPRTPATVALGKIGEITSEAIVDLIMELHDRASRVVE